MSNSEKIRGFQFEPRRTKNYPDGDLESSWETCYDDSEEEENILMNKEKERTEDFSWCLCMKCSSMSSVGFLTAAECLCCHEIDAASYFNLNVQGNCITENESFKSIVLMRENLWTALVGMHDRESTSLPPRDNVPTKTYRYAAYRQFTWWVHNRLGRGVRRRIPSCVLNKIRETFPAPDAVYVGFSDNGDQRSEVDFSWVFRCEENEET